MAKAEPEREIVRRVLPYSVPAIAVAAVLGGVLSGRDAAISAALAMVVVFAFFVSYSYSLVYAARISPMLLMAVGLGGFMVRIAFFVVLLLLLRDLSWFSMAAFVVAFVIGTVALLSVEIKMVSGRMQADLWDLPAGQGAAR